MRLVQTPGGKSVAGLANVTVATFAQEKIVTSVPRSLLTLVAVMPATTTYPIIFLKAVYFAKKKAMPPVKPTLKPVKSGVRRNQILGQLSAVGMDVVVVLLALNSGCLVCQVQ